MIAAALLLANLTAVGGVEVRDDTGRIVRLAQPATRIVTLSPHATDLVVNAGAAGRLVGVPPDPDLDKRLSGISSLGGPGALDRETLLSLRPDLVVAWDSGNRASDLAWIENSGIALYRSEPQSIATIGESVVKLGQLSGSDKVAVANARRFNDAINTPCAALPPLDIYLVLWEQPAMTVGGRHWLNDALRLSGLHNILAYVPRGAFHVAAEVRRQLRGVPQISLVRHYDGSADDRLARLLSRPTTAIAEAIQQLCERHLRWSRPQRTE